MKHSISDFLVFLEKAQNQELVNPETVKSWRYAFTYIHDFIPQSAKEDLFSLTDSQINSIVDSYCDTSNKTYDPKTIAVYKSRIRISLAEYKKYTESPESYSYNKQPRTTIEKIHQFTQNRVANVIKNSLRIPIVIRTDVFVEVSGLPADLSKDDVEQITKVLSAYCK